MPAAVSFPLQASGAREPSLSLSDRIMIGAVKFGPFIPVIVVSAFALFFLILALNICITLWQFLKKYYTARRVTEPPIDEAQAPMRPNGYADVSDNPRLELEGVNDAGIELGELDPETARYEFVGVKEAAELDDGQGLVELGYGWRGFEAPGPEVRSPPFN